MASSYRGRKDIRCCGGHYVAENMPGLRGPAILSGEDSLETTFYSEILGKDF